MLRLYITLIGMIQRRLAWAPAKGWRAKLWSVPHYVRKSNTNASFSCPSHLIPDIWLLTRFPLTHNVSSLPARVHGVMSINVRWCLVWSHSSPWSPVAASGLTLWSGSSQCQAVLGPWSGSVQPLHPEASTEWLSLVTTPEIAASDIIPVSKTEQEWVWGNEGWLSPQTLGCVRGWWRNWALFGYWFIWPVLAVAPVSGAASVQLPVRQPWPPTACHTGNARRDGSQLLPGKCEN